MSSQPIVQYKHVNKTYPNGKKALFDINLTVNQGDFVCLIGTSGCGKTTTMRMINRMLTPSSGEVLVEGKNVMEENPIDLRRHIGYVIQSIGLIPHMTLEENIEIVPKLLKWPEEKRQQRARELMKLVEMPESYLQRYPHELSGGQQQRIGVIRALAADQKVILMDEPFGALDPITREKLQVLVKKLQQEMGKTIIMITHDMDEALKLSTKLVVMDKGRIIQEGSPEQIVRKPVNQFVRGLIGEERLAKANAIIATADSIMHPNPVTIEPDESIFTAFASLHDHHVDSLLVVDEQQHLIGELDVAQMMALRGKDRQAKVGDIMTKNVPTVFEDDRLSTITKPLLERNYKYMPVTDHQGRLVGLITRSALADIIYQQIWGSDDTEAVSDEEGD